MSDSIDAAARRRMLVARHHLARTASTVTEATADLLALHCSDPITPHLGLWARVVDYEPAHLDRCVANASLWRVHAMRRTLWVASAAEIGMLGASVGDKIARAERKRLQGWLEPVVADPERWLKPLEDAVTQRVIAQPGISTRELRAHIPELGTKVRMGSGKWVAESPVGSRLLFVLAMELRIKRSKPAGTWRSSQYGWTAPTEVLPAETVSAKTDLVARYLDRFGPVTSTDIRWWSGLGVRDIKRALASLGAREVRLDAGSGWVLSELPIASAEEVVSLLPGLDPTPMGYKERDWFLGDHAADLFDRNGNIGPTVWVDGRIVGGWAVRSDGTVAWRALEPIATEIRAAVDVEAHRLEAWLGGLSITPRFRTPLERSLS